MQNKSKEQILDEMQRSQSIKRKRTIIMDNFYPALIEATISVDEAKALVQAMGSSLMGEVMKTMRERKFSEISTNVHKILCSDGQREEEIKKLLATLEGESLFDAREIIEGMSNAIEMMIREEMSDRKLDTLKADWTKYLNSGNLK
jgi:hypothetical protein